jgi:hypothetical protein
LSATVLCLGLWVSVCLEVIISTIHDLRSAMQNLPQFKGRLAFFL